MNDQRKTVWALDSNAPAPETDEVAAAIAAIAYLLAEQPEPYIDAEPWEWRASASAIVQGLAPERYPQRLGWNNVERLRRAGRGTSGIVGL